MCNFENVKNDILLFLSYANPLEPKPLAAQWPFNNYPNWPPPIPPAPTHPPNHTAATHPPSLGNDLIIIISGYLICVFC